MWKARKNYHSAQCWEKGKKKKKQKYVFIVERIRQKNPQSRKIKNYCLDLFCRLDENVNWIFLCNENVWFFKCKIAHCANWETNILNEWLYTPYHFTVNINLIKELERRRKPISKLSKHPDWLAHWSQSLLGVFWGLFEVFSRSFLRSFWGSFW